MEESLEYLIPESVKKEYYESGACRYYTLREFANKMRFRGLKNSSGDKDKFEMFGSFES